MNKTGIAVLATATLMIMPLATSAQTYPCCIQLDGCANTVPLGTEGGAAQIEVLKGTYTVTMASDYQLRPGALVNKAILHADTVNDPDGFVWVVTGGQTTTITLSNHHYDQDSMMLCAALPEGSDNTGDNSGGATITLSGPATCPCRPWA